MNGEKFEIVISPEERIIEVAKYMVEHKATLRQTAKALNISKTTVHSDVRYRIFKLDPVLAMQVKEVIEYNKSVRSIRGGAATTRRYAALREKSLTK